PSGLTNEASPSFSAGATEAGATFECKLDGPGAATGTYAGCSATKAYSGLSDGAYAFSVRAIDAAGNIDASPATRTFTLDATPPVAPTITSPTQGAWITSSS